MNEILRRHGWKRLEIRWNLANTLRLASGKNWCPSKLASSPWLSEVATPPKMKPPPTNKIWMWSHVLLTVNSARSTRKYLVPLLKLSIASKITQSMPSAQRKTLSKTLKVASRSALKPAEGPMTVWERMKSKKFWRVTSFGSRLSKHESKQRLETSKFSYHSSMRWLNRQLLEYQSYPLSRSSRTSSWTKV